MLTAVLLCLPASWLLFASQAELLQGESYTAMATGQSMPLNIQIEQYTPYEVGQRLAVILDKVSLEQLRKELAKLKVGRIFPDGQSGTDIDFARKIETESGYRIILARVGGFPFFETSASQASQEHPLGWIELQVDKQGRGEGGMITAAKIWFSEQGVLEVESRGHQFTQLTDVRRSAGPQ
jgi:hypothetical protein